MGDLPIKAVAELLVDGEAIGVTAMVLPGGAKATAGLSRVRVGDAVTPYVVVVCVPVMESSRDGFLTSPMFPLFTGIDTEDCAIGTDRHNDETARCRGHC